MQARSAKEDVGNGNRNEAEKLKCNKEMKESKGSFRPRTSEGHGRTDSQHRMQNEALSASGAGGPWPAPAASAAAPRSSLRVDGETRPQRISNDSKCLTNCLKRRQHKLSEGIAKRNEANAVKKETRMIERRNHGLASWRVVQQQQWQQCQLPLGWPELLLRFTLVLYLFFLSLSLFR